MGENRNLIQYIIVALKGMAMGAADVVPGVSGGTIAFISGIYEELITSLNNIDLQLFRLWRSEGLKAAWKKLNMARGLALSHVNSVVNRSRVCGEISFARRSVLSANNRAGRRWLKLIPPCKGCSAR